MIEVTVGLETRRFKSTNSPECREFFNQLSLNRAENLIAFNIVLIFAIIVIAIYHSWYWCFILPFKVGLLWYGIRRYRELRNSIIIQEVMKS